jgi:MGT family glycosyltransferase
MNILIVTIEAGGNVPPVLNAIRQLSAAGHHVVVLGEPCLKELAEKAGAGFTPFTEYFTKTDRKLDMFEDWKSKNKGFENVIFGPAEIVVKETLSAIQNNRTELLIADVVLPAALIAGEAMHIPRVCLFHFPEYLPGPNRPPGGLGLTPGKNVIGRMIDRLTGIVFNLVFNKYLPKINSIRANLKVSPLKNVADLFHQSDLRIIQTCKAFDFPINPEPENVRYTGPVLDDPDWVNTWKNPWNSEDKRPLVVVSLSSTFQNQKQVIANCIAALGKLNVRGLVTLGLAMEHEQFSIPENVKVISNGSHAQIFPHADCIITHAGHGTVMRALSNGVPLVCLPMGRDQGDNAAKVAYHKAGIALSANAGVRKIYNAVLSILNNPSYRENARILGEKINSDTEKCDLVAEVEQLMKTTCTNATEIA